MHFLYFLILMIFPTSLNEDKLIKAPKIISKTEKTVKQNNLFKSNFIYFSHYYQGLYIKDLNFILLGKLGHKFLNKNIVKAINEKINYFEPYHELIEKVLGDKSNFSFLVLPHQDIINLIKKDEVITIGHMKEMLKGPFPSIQGEINIRF